jgi:predicted enzyme related to lactoylglutathione lyase
MRQSGPQGWTARGWKKAAVGTTIVSAPLDGSFGRTFTFADPDGYHVTLHDRG